LANIFKLILAHFFKLILANLFVKKKTGENYIIDTNNLKPHTITCLRGQGRSWLVSTGVS
jgi:hypothetical protein